MRIRIKGNIRRRRDSVRIRIKGNSRRRRRRRRRGWSNNEGQG